MSQISQASSFQIDRLRAIKQSRGALLVIRRRIDRLTGSHTPDKRLEDSFAAIMDRLGAIEADTWNNIALMSPVDEAARKAIYDRSLAWFKEDNNTIAHLLGFYDAYPSETEDKFRREVMEIFNDN